VTELAGKRVLIVATAGPEAPERCAAPFVFAGEAARRGAGVSICFVLRSALLLKKGLAETLYAKEGGRPVSDFIRLGLRAGVELRVCDAALEMCDMTPDDLIEEAEDLVGPSFLITEGLKADLVLSF
jgi:predicted peroxiredoxin